MMLFIEWTTEHSELRLSFLIINCYICIEQQRHTEYVLNWLLPQFFSITAFAVINVSFEMLWYWYR